MARSKSESKKAGVGGGIFALFVFGIFATAGSIGVYILSQEISEHLETYSWTETQCEVFYQARKIVPASSDRYRLDMRYRYQVDGLFQEGSRITPGVSDYSVREAEKLRYRLREGTKLPCYFNPSDPSQSFLIRRSAFLPLIVLFPACFALFGFAGLFFAFSGDSGKGASSPLSRRRNAQNSSNSNSILYVVFTAFLLIGGALFYFFGVRPFYRSYQAKNWVAKECTVISSRVKTHSGESTTYSIDIVYHYDVDAERFQSDRYDFLGGSSSGYKSKKKVVDSHPRGKIFTCYVDPNDPTESVINREISLIYLVALIPLAFVLFGFWGLQSLLRGKSGDAYGNSEPFLGPERFGSDRDDPKRNFTKSNSSERYSSSRFRGSSFPTSIDQSNFNRGELKLTEGSTRLGRLIALILFATFWNGIVFTIAYFALSDGSGFSWGLLVFLIPFGLVGAGVLIAIPFAFLALFQPKVELFITPGTPRIGERMTIRWVVTGRVHWLESLEVVLVGKEVATYRRGTSTHTDREVFFEHSISKSTRGLERGDTHFDIPIDFIPSFSGPHNKIVWTLNLKGVITNYPDLSQEFEVEIMPADKRALEDSAAD